MKRLLFLLGVLLQSAAFAQPGAPQNLSVNNGPYRITLSWNAVSGTNILYKVYRGTNPGNIALYQDSLDTFGYADTGATPGIAYHYRVSAFNASGLSPQSNIAQGQSNRIFYVATTGGNNGNSGAQNAPFATIGFGVFRTNQGDTLILEPGTYAERINLSGKNIVLGSRYILTHDTSFVRTTKISGSTIANIGPLVFETGTAGGSPIRALMGLTLTQSKKEVINLSNALLRWLIIEQNGTNAAAGDGLIRLNNHSTMDSCVIRNNYGAQSFGVVSYANAGAQGSSGFNFTHNLVYQNNFPNGALILSPSDLSLTLKVENNRIFENAINLGRPAVVLEPISSSIIPFKLFFRNNLVVSNTGIGFGMFAPRTNDTLIFTHNTIADNAVGVHFSIEKTWFCYMGNNIISRNTQNSSVLTQEIVLAGQPFFPMTRVVFKNNVIGFNGSGSPFPIITNYDLLNIPDSSGNIRTAVQFRDTASFIPDYRLASNSPLIASGLVHANNLPYDINGNSRPTPVGSNPEPGAFELNTKYAAPNLLELEPGNAQMRLYWSLPNAGGISRIRIWRSLTPITDQGGGTLVIDNLIASQTQYLDINLNNNTPYYYRIQAGDAQGHWSELSNTLSNTPRVPPAVPGNFLAASAARKNFLSWNAVSGTNIRYQVFRGINNDSLVLYKDSLFTTSFSDLLVQPYQKYRYALRAVDENNVRGNFTDTMQASAVRVWFVGNNGNNLNPGTEALPLLTLSAATTQIFENDTLILLPGTYHERLNFLSKGFVVGSKTLLTGNNQFIGTTIISGQNLNNSLPLVFQDNIETVLKTLLGITFTRSKGEVVSIRNARIIKCVFDDNITAPSGTTNAVSVRGLRVIDSCEFKNNQHPYAFNLIGAGPGLSNDTLVIRNNTFTNNRFQAGIFLSDPSNNVPAVIENNVFFKNSAYGFNSMHIQYYGSPFPSRMKLIIRNNLMAKGNGLIGVALGPAFADSIYVLNNTITESNIGLAIDGSANNVKFWVQNNIFSNTLNGNNELSLNIGSNQQLSLLMHNNRLGWNTNKHPLVGVTNLSLLNSVDTANNSGGNPKYIDTTSSNANYRLQSTSECIGAGLLNPLAGWRDLDNKPRIQPFATVPDLGCYESAARFPAPVIKASEAGDKKIELFWELPPTMSYTKVLVYRATQSIHDSVTLNPIFTSSGQVPVYFLDTFSLQNLTPYYYRIRLSDDNGNLSAASNEWIATPRVPPAAPANFMISTGPRRLRLSWNASAGAYRYQIFKDTIPNPQRLFVDTAFSLWTIDSLLEPGKTYYYAIRAIDVFNTKGSFSTGNGVPNRIWYVANNGNNSNHGLSSFPYNQINFAYARAAEEDTILLEPGTYFEQLTLNINSAPKRLTIASRYLFEPNPAHITNTIVDGSQSSAINPLITDLSNGNTQGATKIHRFIGLTFTKSQGLLMALSNVHLQNLIIKDNNKQGNTNVEGMLFLRGTILIDSCVFIDNLTPPHTLVGLGGGFFKSSLVVTNNLFQNNRYVNTCMHLGQSDDSISFTLRSNKFLQNQGTATGNAVFQYHSPNPNFSKLYISNNLIANNTGSGIVMTPSVQDSLFITHNTITQNAVGVDLAADKGKYSIITNNIISHNSSQSNNNFRVGGTPVFPKPKVIFRNNFIGNTRVNNALSLITNVQYYDTVGSANNLSGVPYFKDSAAKDFSLSNISWAIGKGIVTPHMPAIDLNGTTRPAPLSSSPDIGAFESRFNTIAPRLDSINTQNSLVRIVWFADTANAKQYDIYRGTSLNNLSLLARISNNQQVAFVDSFPILQARNYYGMYTISKGNDTSGISNNLSAVPLTLPSLVNPQNKQTKVARTLNFTWQRNTEAVNYRFQLARSRDFLTLINKDTTTADTFYRQTSNLLFNTKYYWRVRANNSTGFSIWRTDSFQTLVRTPVIDSINSHQERVWLRWNDGLSTGLYKYVVTRINTLTNDVRIDSINAGIYIHIDSTVASGIQYHYRVQAMNIDSVLSDFSNSRFIIPLRAPILAEPGNNSLSSSRIPTFRFEDYLFATSFRIQVSLNQNFTPLEVDTIRPDSFFKYHKLMLPNAYYYWRVQSRDSLGTSKWSAPFGFQTELSVPNLNAIVAQSTRLTLHWNDTGSANVIKYYIYKRSGSGPSILYDSTVGGVFSYTDSNLTNGTTYYYRIAALSPMGIMSVLSAERSGIPYEQVMQINGARGPWRNALWWKSAQQSNVTYEVLRGTTLANLQNIKTAITDTFWLDTTSTAGVPYIYAVRSKDALGNLSVLSKDTVLIANRVWYVDTNTYANSYGSAHAPYKSVAFAMQRATAQDTVIIAPGIYNERLQLGGKRLLLSSKFLFDPIPVYKSGTIISGNGLGPLPLVSDNLNQPFRLFGLHLTAASQIAVQSLTTSGETQVQHCLISQSGSFAVNGVVLIKRGLLENVEIKNCLGNRVVQGGDFVANTALNCKRVIAQNNSAQGALFFADRLMMENCLIYRNTADAILSGETNTQGNDTVLWVLHSSIVKNIGAGFKVGGNGHFIFLQNQLALNTDSFRFIAVSQLGTLRLKQNLLEGFGSIAIPGTLTTDITGNIANHAYYQDTAQNNFALAPWNGGIGIGNNSWASSSDLVVNLRPMPTNSNADAGAFESTEGLSAPYISHVSAIGSTVSLTFSSTVNNAARFVLYRFVNGGFEPTDTVAGNVFGFNLNNQALAQDNRYVVQAQLIGGLNSGWSNEVQVKPLLPVVLALPANQAVWVAQSTTYHWNKSLLGGKYRIQASLQEDFTTLLMDSLQEDTFVAVGPFPKNAQIFWRVRVEENNVISNWSAPFTYQTLFTIPVLEQLIPSNKKNTLVWKQADTSKIKGYRILRSLSANFQNAQIIKDTFNNEAVSYADNGLTNNQTYYYAVRAINYTDVESENSNVLGAEPFNKKPVIQALLPVKLPAQGRNIYNNYTFNNPGVQDPDGVIDSAVWYVNGKRISNAQNLTYDFRQGTSIVTLKAWDNDQAFDSAYTFLDAMAWERKREGPISTGLSAANANRIYVANEFKIGGFKNDIYLYDSLGNASLPSSVGEIVTATPCITPDTTLIVTNGIKLTAIDKFLDTRWEVTLTGSTNVTATVDSVLQRIYIGLSNGTFRAYNYLTGGSPVWTYSPPLQAVIQSSAVITPDRKLIYPDTRGRLLGFDVSTATSQGNPANPAWQFNSNDSINTSPAVDNSGFIYVGTTNGKLKKLEFTNTQTVNEIWSTNLGSMATNSPVIDANGFIYIGCANGNLYKVEPVLGTVVGSFNAGDTIKSTPAISSKGKIYVGSVNGYLHAIDTTMAPYWFYKDSSAIQANILHVGKTTYIGTMSGKIIAFWDDDLPFGRKKTQPEKDPMWGTFQGNAQRTGAKNFDTSQTIGVKEIRSSKDLLLLIYPNPTQRYITIEANGSAIEEVSVLDLQGKTLINEVFIPNAKIETDLAELPTGIYLMVIKTTKGISIRKIHKD